MSTFEVKFRTITQLDPHPNADKLECVVIGGYKAVVQKDIHKVGDLIAYIPEDSVFTDLPIAERLGIARYLTGKLKNRVKAVRLRGLLSQGIVLPAQLVADEIRSHDKFDYQPWEGNSVAEDLAIEKYEEPIPIEMAGHVRPWPTFLPHYDIENIKRPESMAAMVEGEEVVATEKLHGTNFTVAIGPGLEFGEDAFVCSRRLAIKESETNVYWRAVKKYDLINKLKRIWDEYYVVNGVAPTSLSFHGEVVGVQDLKYGFVNGDIGFYLFDIMINGEFINHGWVRDTCRAHDIPMVPEVYRGPYSYDTIANLAQGKTTLGAGHVLEGVVVKPIVERRDGQGRVQFKFINDDYLTRVGGTELH